MFQRNSQQGSAPRSQDTDEIASPKILTEIVYSPDDGGHWIGQTELDTYRNRASVEIYRSRMEAMRAVDAGKVKWEAWS